MDIHIEIFYTANRELVVEQRLNASRKAFMSFLFHEVRVPLNSVSLGVTQLETLEMMKEGTTFMGSTLNDVLSIQKMEEGKQELHCKPFMIYDLINSVLLSLHGNIKAEGAVVEVSVQDLMPQVIGAGSSWSTCWLTC